MLLHFRKCWKHIYKHTNLYEVGTVIILMLQMGKLRRREFKDLVQPTQSVNSGADIVGFAMHPLEHSILSPLEDPQQMPGSYPLP